MTQPERLAAIAPGTPMWKAVPPRLVGPYLTGQRTVLAGYVYRAQDVRFHTPAEAYLALSLGLVRGSTLRSPLTTPLALHVRTPPRH